MIVYLSQWNNICDNEWLDQTSLKVAFAIFATF